MSKFIDNNDEAKIRELLKAVYQPESASPEFKERLRQRLTEKVPAEASGVLGLRWQVRLWAPVALVVALAIFGYGVWLSISAFPMGTPSELVLVFPEPVTPASAEMAAETMPGQAPSEPAAPLPGETLPPALEPAASSPDALPVFPESAPPAALAPDQPLPTAVPLPAAVPITPPSIEPSAVGMALTQPLATGKVEVRVTDAPPRREVSGVMVTVSSVEIHKAGASDDDKDWLPMRLVGNNTFDLLKVRGLESVLATADLGPGIYTQLRMEVTRVEVILDGQLRTARLPSDKLRFVQPFQVAADSTTVLLFDFDALRSLSVTPSNRVVFNPVIKFTARKPHGSLRITTLSLPGGQAGVAYNAALTAAGGQTPYTWSVYGGTLPPGLGLAAGTGLLSGAPTVAGDFTFTVMVVDSASPARTDTQDYALSIAVPSP